MRSLVFASLCVLLMLTAATAQPDRFSDRLTVQFEKPVVVNDNLTLQPGTYTFQQVRSPAPPDVFRVIDQKGNNIGMTAVASTASYKSSAPNDVPAQTQVVLKELGNKRYLDRMWFAGQNHGYNFSLASNARSASGKGSNSNEAKASQGNDTTASSGKRTQGKDIIVLAIMPVDTSASASSGTSSQSADSTDSSRASETSSSRTQTSASGETSNLATSSNTQDSGSSAQLNSGSTGSMSSSAQSNNDSTTGANTTSSSNAQDSGSSAQSSPGSTGSMSSSAQSNNDSMTGANSSSSSNSASSGGQMQVDGCVTGPYGGSYMLLSSKDGKRYQLSGDYDNIRESLGRTVTVWGVPSADNTTGSTNSSSSAGSNNQNSANQAAGSSAQGNSGSGSQTTSGSGTQMSSGDNASNPVIIAVSKIQRVAEQCDSSTLSNK